MRSYRYLTLVAMLYLACELASLVLSYKIVKLPMFYGSAASFIFPITYTWNDVITEVYGYRQTKNIIWTVFVCDLVFVALTGLIAQVSSVDAISQGHYEHVLGPLWRAFFSELCGVLVGAFINAMLLSRWKILLKGKWFWLRSIGSSALGELVMLVISVPIAMFGVLSLHEMTALMTYAFLYKLFFASIVSLPANGLVYVLKRQEGLDVYDYDISYSPFVSMQRA